jgi:hypothetical protein
MKGIKELLLCVESFWFADLHWIDILFGTGESDRKFGDPFAKQVMQTR